MVQRLNSLFVSPSFKYMKYEISDRIIQGVHQTPVELWALKHHVWLGPTCQDGRSTWDVHLCLRCNLIRADQRLNTGLYLDITMISRQQHYLRSYILSSEALCQQCYETRQR